jgi:hypothetical protein
LAISSLYNNNPYIVFEIFLFDISQFRDYLTLPKKKQSSSKSKKRSNKTSQRKKKKNIIGIDSDQENEDDSDMDFELDVRQQLDLVIETAASLTNSNVSKNF